jgi:CHAP domain-containing protein
VTSAAQILDMARSQLGTIQQKNGSNKYGIAYGMDQVAWCAEFQWWVFTSAGAANLIPKTAYTPTFYSWFQQKGQASKTPKVGSLVFFDWPGDGVNRIQHVGIVEAINADGSITTIEGNTTSGNAGDQSNGGGVFRRKRALSLVVGFGHPAYDGAAAPAPATPASAGDMATLQRGMGPNDSRVMALQRFLNAYNWQPELPLITTSVAAGFGTYGPATQAVVAKAQAQCGITGSDADGSIVGPRTKAEFAKRGARW